MTVPIGDSGPISQNKHQTEVRREFICSTSQKTSEHKEETKRQQLKETRLTRGIRHHREGRD